MIPPKVSETVWAFDLGKGSIEEAVRQGTKFLHNASLLIPADRQKSNGAAKAPYGSHRSRLATVAARLFPTYRGRSTGFDPRLLYR
jgi:hypothetical protein